MLRPPAAAVLVWVAACGDNLRIEDPGLVALTGASPVRAGCDDEPAPSKSYLGLEVEPSLAVDPTDDRHLVAAWQQDRWNNGGAHAIGTAVSRDGGHTWKNAISPASKCGGGSFGRASDPWVAIDAAGTPYHIALAFDGPGPRNAVVVSSSSDGGATWNAPIELIEDNDVDVFNDKETIAADPVEPGRLYAVWDRLTGLTEPTQPIGTGPTMLARATAGTWESARPIFDPGVDAQTIGNLLVVLPDGTLVIAFDRILKTSSMQPVTDLEVMRSADRGDTWSVPVSIATIGGVDAIDPSTGTQVRDGEGLPSFAVDRASGALYLAWEDARFSNGTREGIAVARSRDGGLTWEPPVQVNGEPAADAFTPVVAVAADGTVGIFYYDFRDPRGATAWLATSGDGGTTWSDEPLTRAFELGPALVGSTFFLGDYQGLAARGNRFVPLFARAFADTDPTDIVVRP